VSKSAVSHLVRELAIRLAPVVRVNGIGPATVVGGSAMFPRGRVAVVADEVRHRVDRRREHGRVARQLARFYASRTLLREPITPELCADAILWLAGEHSGRTSGHIIPVDGGLPKRS